MTLPRIEQTSPDLVIIGSGPGGYVAAIRASQLGMRVTIVERDALGGICLNWGCIPTKALLRTADVYENFQHALEFGLAADNVRFDLDAIVKRSRGIAGQLSGGVKFLMKKNKITVIEGTASLEAGKDAPKVRVVLKAGGEQVLTPTNVILATGARARTIPAAGLEPDGKLIWTYREAMVPTVFPKRLLVIGSGAIGIEFASFYRALGAEVTVVEAVGRILSAEDEEISALATKALKKRGIRIETSAQLQALTPGKETVAARIKLADGQEQAWEFDRAILAIGIVGNVENLGLEALGVAVKNTHVETRDFGQTSVKGLYAIGDVTGPPWLAHKASHEGISAVEAIAGLHPHALDVSRVPGCTYSSPQIASVGLTEAKAVAAGHKVRVGRFPFSGNGKAIALGEPDGLVKTVFNAETGELLGAHMIGAEVTELIQGFAIAMSLETTEAQLMETIFPHPTISETMHEAVLDAYGRVLHI